PAAPHPPTRHCPGVAEARRIAQEALDKAVAYETAQTSSYLAKNGIPIYPKILETYNGYVVWLME
ncbi:HD domain-containing protein, partial [Streptococcus suis]